MEDSNEPTFRSYNAKQGATYSINRPTYHQNLYKKILNHHISTGGNLNTVLDAGCGPGNAVRDLATHFTRAIGLDPSPGMIQTARSLGGTSSDGSSIYFELSTAEKLGAYTSLDLPDSTVDLIIAATAAHWFDMTLFWPRAAQLLRPGGTVALWAARGGYIHDSTPNHSAIQNYITSIQDRIFRSYAREGTKVAFGLYADLVLPWQLESDSAGPLFEEETFFKKIWSKDVVCEDGDEFFAGQASSQFLSVDLDTLEKMMGTKGTVTRWRENNAEKVGTDEDIVKVMRAEIGRLLYEAGVKEGEEVLNMGVEGVLMMVKRAH